MFCRNCGAQLSEDSLFCTNCGTRVENAGSAGAPVQPNVSYGQNSFGGGQNGYFQPTGQLVLEAGKVVVYNGTGAIGVTYGDGLLYVFDDRLEFHKKHGTMAGMGINAVVGMAVSVASAKKKPVDVWLYRDMARVYTAKHAGIISKICIEFHNKKAFSITLSGHGGKTNELVESLCDTINQYL